jgi:hypothetical protein
MTRMRWAIAAAVALVAWAPASAQGISDADWEKIRAALTSFVADNVCAKVPGCSVLAVSAVEGVNKVVEIAVDRHFRAEDQELADRTGITIRYADGTVVTPKKR